MPITRAIPCLTTYHTPSTSSQPAVETSKQSVSNTPCTASCASSQVNYALNATLTSWVANAQLPPANQLSITELATTHNLSLQTCKNYFLTNGQLTLRGKNVLARLSGHKFKKITPHILQTWIDTPQESRPSIKKFAQTHNLTFRSCKSCLTKSGQLTPRGENIHARLSEGQFTRLTPKILQLWVDTPHTSRPSIEAFALTHKLYLRSLKNYILRDGHLSDDGKYMLARASGETFAPITPDILQKWTDTPQASRPSVEEFSVTHKLYLRSLKNYILMGGQLSEYGKYMLARASGETFAPITPDILQTWLDTPQASS
ncbi:MAG: hypothetical protein IT497_05825, partial [Ottowia sp.]|nr:hypothetical protein [Ottowia sp.]